METILQLHAIYVASPEKFNHIIRFTKDELTKERSSFVKLYEEGFDHIHDFERWCHENLGIDINSYPF